MKIIILDGHTLNPGDLDWQPLAVLGELEAYERTPREEILSRAAEAEILLTNKTVLDRKTLGMLPQLRYIGVLATGYDVVDVDCARKCNIAVTNVPAYGADSVAQMVFAHILRITNNVAEHARDVEQGGWQRTDDYCYWLTPQMELKDKILGIIGYGKIGQATARLARAFQMEVIIHTRTVPRTLPEGCRHAGQDEIFKSSDFVTLHCPLTEQTKYLINRRNIELMKESAVLINCSRGPLVEEEALAQALNSGRIRAAGLDVLSEEPVRKDNPLIGARNCTITPHIAWATREARNRLLQTAASNLKSFLQGKDQNRIC